MEPTVLRFSSFEEMDEDSHPALTEEAKQRAWDTFREVGEALRKGYAKTLIAEGKPLPEYLKMYAGA